MDFSDSATTTLVESIIYVTGELSVFRKGIIVL